MVYQIDKPQEIPELKKPAATNVGSVSCTLTLVPTLPGLPCAH